MRAKSIYFTLLIFAIFTNFCKGQFTATERDILCTLNKNGCSYGEIAHVAFFNKYNETHIANEVHVCNTAAFVFLKPPTTTTTTTTTTTATTTTTTTTTTKKPATAKVPIRFPPIRFPPIRIPRIRIPPVRHPPWRTRVPSWRFGK